MTMRLSLTTLLLLAAPCVAQAASFVRDTSAGVACSPANGAAAAKFTRGNNQITNIGTTDQFVVCHLPAEDAFEVVNAPVVLSLHYAMGASPGTIACIAQTGAYYHGLNQVQSSAAQSYAVAALENGYIGFDVGRLFRDQHWHVLTINCRLPPGATIGLIEWRQEQ